MYIQFQMCKQLVMPGYRFFNIYVSQHHRMNIDAHMSLSSQNLYLKHIQGKTICDIIVILQCGNNKQ